MILASPIHLAVAFSHHVPSRRALDCPPTSFSSFGDSIPVDAYPTREAGLASSRYGSLSTFGRRLSLRAVPPEFERWGRSTSSPSAGHVCVLAVDDDASVVELVRELLTPEGFEVGTALSGEEAIQRAEHKRYDLVLLDLNLPDQNGLAVMERLMAIDERLPVIVLTGSQEITTVVESFRRGAFDFLSKPFTRAQLLEALNRGLSFRASLSRDAGPWETGSTTDHLSALLGGSRVMTRLYELVERLGPTSAPVFILGESGTGKELIARELHRLSAFSNKPFVKVSCDSDPTILERELFGYQRGAFREARESRPGILESSHTNSLLLDEVSALPQRLQERLLEVMQVGEAHRMGSTVVYRTEPRFLSTISAELGDDAPLTTIRPDLRYRLSRNQIALPALRDRMEDLPALAAYYLGTACAKYNKRRHTLSRKALEMLSRHTWPGNIRELSELLERTVLTANRPIIRPADLQAAGFVRVRDLEHTTIKQLTDTHIAEALRRASGNVTQAAKLLGISRSTLYRKLQE